MKRVYRTRTEQSECRSFIEPILRQPSSTTTKIKKSQLTEWFDRVPHCGATLVTSCTVLIQAT